MATKRKRRSVRPAKRIPLHKRHDVRREEINRIVELLNERGVLINDLRHNQDIQFRRIAQIQAELDTIKPALEKLRLNAGSRD